MNDIEEDYYETRLDKIFGQGSIWQHRTFRTIFDPFSNEWNNTTYDRKIEILETVIENGENLELLIDNYKERYNNQNRKDIAKAVENALVKLLAYKLTIKK